MTFAEKLRTLRKQKNLSQIELARAIGVSLRTIRGWEAEGRYPRQRDMYVRLAKALQCDISYLLTDQEAFIAEAGEQFGRRGARDARALVSELTGLFAGGRMADEDMDALMFAVQEAYVEAKKKNREKFTPKKYRKKMEP